MNIRATERRWLTISPLHSRATISANPYQAGGEGIGKLTAVAECPGRQGPATRQYCSLSDICRMTRIVLKKHHTGSLAQRPHRELLIASDLLRTKNLQIYRAVLEEYLRLLTVEKVMDAAERDGSLARVLDDLTRGAVGPMEAAARMVKETLRS